MDCELLNGFNNHACVEAKVIYDIDRLSGATAHLKADNILLDFISYLGFQEVRDAYEDARNSEIFTYEQYPEEV